VLFPKTGVGFVRSPPMGSAAGFGKSPPLKLVEAVCELCPPNPPNLDIDDPPSPFCSGFFGSCAPNMGFDVLACVPNENCGDEPLEGAKENTGAFGAASFCTGAGMGCEGAAAGEVTGPPLFDIGCEEVAAGVDGPVVAPLLPNIDGERVTPGPNCLVIPPPKAGTLSDEEDGLLIPGAGCWGLAN
jgi:hypothetical protein